MNATALKYGKYIAPDESHYRAGLYLRLSRDDKDSSEASMSIQNQRAMLLQFADERGYSVSEVYIDDGYSGTNFERPGFKKMVRDIENKRINMVITKDLSRLGRNHVTTSHYVENVFPENNIRYIAINDNCDTVDEDNDIVPFKNILNEMYAKDISRKVRSAKRTAALAGKFLGSIPSYGYKRSSDDRCVLAIDEYAAGIVRRIYTMFLDDISIRGIAVALNEEKILPPQEYYFSQQSGDNPYSGNAKSWCYSTVKSILTKEIYTGKTVQGKRKMKSFKSKKACQTPPEQWIVVEGTHEAIIDIKSWHVVQSKFERKDPLSEKESKISKPRPTVSGEVSLFSNLLYCQDCGSRLTFNSIQRKNELDKFYRCSRYIQHGKAACASHRIKEKLLAESVLDDIRKNAQLAKEDEDSFLKKLHSRTLAEREKELALYNEKHKLFSVRLIEIKNLIKKSFEKNVSGLLPDDMFKELLSGYEAEQSELTKNIEAANASISLLSTHTGDAAVELQTIKRYADITELTRTVATTLIKSIHISEAKKVDNKKVYELNIHYRFENSIALSEGGE